MTEKDRYFVYMLECSDGSYYTGYTSDLDKRVKRHNKGRGESNYVKKRLPVKLVYAKEYKCYKNAVKAERRLKKLPRKRKEKLIKIYKKTNKEKF